EARGLLARHDALEEVHELVAAALEVTRRRLDRFAEKLPRARVIALAIVVLSERDEMPREPEAHAHLDPLVEPRGSVEERDEDLDLLLERREVVAHGHRRRRRGLTEDEVSIARVLDQEREQEPLRRLVGRLVRLLLEELAPPDERRGRD